MITKLIEKLKDPEYRKAFVASQINIGIPFQIRALLKARGWPQMELARRTGMLQPRISAMIRPGKVHSNIETLRRIAEAFDCGLLIKFVPFSELVYWSESFDPERFDVRPFDMDIGKLAAEAPQMIMAGTELARLAQATVDQDTISSKQSAELVANPASPPTPPLPLWLQSQKEDTVRPKSNNVVSLDEYVAGKALNQHGDQVKGEKILAMACQ